MKVFYKFSFFILLSSPIFFLGCSSKETKVDGEVEASLAKGDDSLPSTDEVGSIPEDKVDSVEEMAKDLPKSTTSGDPFADLEDGLKGKEEGDFTVKNDLPQMPTGGGETRTYTVRRGDTLMKIAFALYGDIDRWKDLKSWNSNVVRSASKLEPGTQLTYTFEGDFEVDKLDHSYLIKSGDTLGGISKTVYGSQKKWRKLHKYNARLIKNPNRIFAGFTLYYMISPQEQQEAETMHTTLGSNPPAAAPTESITASAPSRTSSSTTTQSAAAPPPPPPAAAAKTPASAEPIKNGNEPVAAAPAGDVISQ